MVKLTVSNCVTWPVKGGNAFATVSEVNYTDDVCNKLVVAYPNGQSYDITSSVNDVTVISEDAYNDALANLIESVNKHMKTNTKGTAMEVDTVKAELETVKKDAEAKATAHADELAKARKSYDELQASLTAVQAEIADLTAKMSKKDEELNKMKKKDKGRFRFNKMKAAKAEAEFGETEEVATDALSELSDETFDVALKMAEAALTKFAKLTDQHQTSMKQLTDQTQTQMTKLTEATSVASVTEVKPEITEDAAKAALDNAKVETVVDLAAAGKKIGSDTNEAMVAFATSILNKKKVKKTEKSEK